MAKGRVVSKSDENSNGRPALSPEGRENQLIALAVDLAERKLRDGTASNALLCYLVKLASGRERLEREYLRHQSTLAQAKADAVRAAQKNEAMFEEAIRAMKVYSGHGGEDDDIE